MIICKMKKGLIAISYFQQHSNEIHLSLAHSKMENI